ncbi:vanz family protein [Nitritalea halalkaliphila LW7]|uniref:Vanz family protein n=1 Tax=Nitritalea halalkaliphila LW7 TaxID=1189621 RepID=I5C9K0_9BACT|nr:VanZ family protein [Nitritalea halalkaliphila]EIM78502.1 vanz family protein [Nitritalea halalkaliphila LW7]
MNKRFFPVLVLLIGISIALLLPGEAIPSEGPEIPYVDKIAHFTLFFFLGYSLGFASVHKKHRLKALRKRYLFTIYLLFGVIYAIFIEYLQQLVPNRSFEYADIIANLSGSAVGVSIFYFVYKRNRKFA